jgi:hypothetical protein
MSGNSLASLLAWMKDSSRLLGWGLVVALERRKTNLILLQEYIKRFGEHSYLPPIKGEVMIVDNRRMELIHDFVMDVPALSFENANLNDSKAMLTMSVMGGSQLTLERESAGWKAYKVDEINPLQGPKLYLDLLLNDVSGDVDKDGRVKLDLSKSDNFRLTFAEGQHEQRMGGNFFKDLFNQLPDEKRIYPMGKIERGTDVLMQPRSFELRTQASSTAAARNPNSSEYGDGAVLAMVRMEGRMGGDFPGQSYKYLIPDDQGKNYSATVLFDHNRIAASVMVKIARKMLNVEGFEYVFDQDGNVVSATFSSGTFAVPEHSSVVPVEPGPGIVVPIKVSIEALDFPVSDSQPLVVELAGKKITMKLKSEARGMCFLGAEGQEDGGGLKVPGLFSMDLFAEYELVDMNSDVVLKQTDFKLDSKFKFVPESETLDFYPRFWAEILIYLVSSIIQLMAVILIKAVQSVGLTLELDLNGSISETIQELIKLNFGQSVQGNETYAPHDIGFFGRINPQQTAFLINPMQPIIKASSPQAFATSLAVPGVKWKVENLMDGSGNPGTINETTGAYTAPAASTIKGRFTRVRVTATASSGYYSSALVTVVVDELSIHPLIQVCDIGATVELSAGVLGEGALQWDIKNKVPGESGELKPSDKPEGDRTYHHGPVVTGKTYVIDQIEVKNTHTGGTRSMHVLALQKPPMLVVEIESVDAQKGEVQLTALFDGEPETVDWILPLDGPGSISNGLYRASSAATDRFVLIIAELPFGSRKFEGHIILPLPLVEFPQAYEVMSK